MTSSFHYSTAGLFFKQKHSFGFQVFGVHMLILPHDRMSCMIEVVQIEVIYETVN